MNQTKKTNVAVVGLGYMGQNHVRILSALPDVFLAAVCDVDKEKAEQTSTQYKTNAYSDIKEIVNSEKLDAIFICVPTSLHYQAAVVAASKKIAIFLEKPVCATVKEAKKLMALTKLSKVPVMVGHIERFNPVVIEVKRRIDSGELGKVLHIHTQRFSPPPSRAQDVSVITDLATHDIDIIRYLVQSEPIRLFSETGKNYHKQEDIMSGLIRFKNNVTALIEVSWVHPTKIRSLTIVGENGMYVADYITQELLFYRQNEKVTSKILIPVPDQNWADVIKIAFQSKEPLQLEISAFITALRAKSKMPVTLAEGMFALEVVEKFIKSGQNHLILK